MLGLLNLIVGLICENALSSVAEAENEANRLRDEKREKKISRRQRVATINLIGMKWYSLLP